MTGMADLIRRLSAAGAPAEAIAIAVEAVEAAVEAKRAPERERKRRQRAGQSRDGHGTVTGLPAAPSPGKEVSPGPLPETQPLPASIPPKGPPSFSPSRAELDAIWSLASRRGRERSSRADLERALIAAARRGHALAAIAEGVRAYYASDDATRDGGEFAKGVHRIVEADRWLTFVEAAEPDRITAAELSEAQWRTILAAYDQFGDWQPAFGPRPGESGCLAPEIPKPPSGVGAHIVPFPQSSAA